MLLSFRTTQARLHCSKYGKFTYRKHSFTLQMKKAAGITLGHYFRNSECDNHRFSSRSLKKAFNLRQRLQSLSCKSVRGSQYIDLQLGKLLLCYVKKAHMGIIAEAC